ncbi:MAG: NTPase [Desulfarculaceae bacterium]|jgi:nucleoside-triphosphatase THEP1
MGGRNVLITGPPGSGKSTLIERVIKELDRPQCGFFTREIREKGRRVGFGIITLDGHQGVLAHEGFSSPYRVGRYGVNLKDLEQIAVPALQPADPGCLVVVDEIGKMECFSPVFREALVWVLDSRHDLLGTVSQKGGPLIQKIKKRPDVEVVRLTKENREQLLSLAARFVEPGA